MRPATVAEEFEPIFRFGRFRLNLAGHSLTDESGTEVPLTRGEFNLLKEFVRRSGRVLSRDQLLQALAGRDAEPYDRSIDMSLVRLRRKIEPDPKRPSLIVTVTGSGYKFTAKVTNETAAPAAVESEPLPAAPHAIPERRQLTVLFCDLVGSTALSAQLDPEDFRAVIAAYHRCCANVIRCNGGIVAQLLGDGVLAYFGFPLASEHDTERAIRAGLSIIRSLRTLDAGHNASMHVRLGIATGLVIVGGDGDEADYALIATGETPNLAAKICKGASPDSILVAGSTRRLVGGLFDCRPHEPVTFDDTAEPVEVWQVVGEAAAGSRFEALRGMALTPFVGREEELELLLRRWNQARADRGKVVLISGEPGIGKSRLIRAFQDAIAEQPHIELGFFCSPHCQDSALYPHIAQLERVAGFARDDTDEAKLSKLDAVLAQSDATEDAVMLIAELLSIPTGQHERIQQMTPQLRRDRTLAALVTQLTGLASRQPVLLIYEDWHWIDPSSRELLDRTIEQLEHLPVLLLATFRPEFQPPLVGQANATSLALTGLDRSHTAALIAEIAGEDCLPAEIVQQITERTDGVPLFIEEVTKAAIESGTQAGETLTSTPHPKLAVPATLHASLIARLDRVGPVARDIAQKGAVIGREFRYELIAAIADRRPEPELRQALERLTSAGLLFARGTPPESTYLFKHALVQDTAYRTLVRAQRQKLHRRLAMALEQKFREIAENPLELLAHHFTEAGLAEKAIEYWLHAGRQANARSMMVESARLLHRGIGLLPKIPEDPARWRIEADLQMELANALHATIGQSTLDTGRAFSRARDLRERLADTFGQLLAMYGESAFHFGRGEFATAHGIAAGMLELSRRLYEEAGFAAGNCVMGTCCHWMGEFTAALKHFDAILPIQIPEMKSSLFANVTGFDPRSAALAYSPIDLLILGYPDQAAARLERALLRNRQPRHLVSVALTLVLAAEFHIVCGTQERALGLLHEVIGLAAEQGFQMLHGVAKILLGRVIATGGELAQGLELAQEGLNQYLATGAVTNRTHFLSIIAENLHDTGKHCEALELLNDALEIVAAGQERWFEPELYRVKGECLLAASPVYTAEAEACLERSLMIARNQNAKFWELRAAISLARVWRDHERETDAFGLLMPIYKRFTEGFSTPDLRNARALLADLGNRFT